MDHAQHTLWVRPISEKAMRKFETNPSTIVKLEYPCRDSSKNVEDFAKWSRFKKREDAKIVSRKSCQIWNKDLLKRINNQGSYVVSPVQKKTRRLPPVRLNKAHVARADYTQPYHEKDVSEIFATCSSSMYSTLSKRSGTSTEDIPITQQLLRHEKLSD